MKEPYKKDLLGEVLSKNDFIASLNDANMNFVFMKVIETMA